MTDEGSGDCDALFLTAGEGGSLGTDDSFVALWEGLNEFKYLQGVRSNLGMDTFASLHALSISSWDTSCSRPRRMLNLMVP